MTEDAGVPLVRTVAVNTYILSGMYLATGIISELLRRYHPVDWVLRLGFALDALPARVLEELQLLPVLRDAYFNGRLSPLELRLVFSVTTLGVIFVLALALGTTLALAQTVFTRRPGRPRGP